MCYAPLCTIQEDITNHTENVSQRYIVTSINGEDGHQISNIEQPPQGNQAVKMGIYLTFCSIYMLNR